MKFSIKRFVDCKEENTIKTLCQLDFELVNLVEKWVCWIAKKVNSYVMETGAE